MSLYDSIARVYDNINAEIDYNTWADFIEACFEKYLSQKPELVLDLACGTGSMTLTLRKRGYDMIGADYSEDMLMEAYEKAYDNEISDVLFLKQDMRSFELYGTVGAIVCCLDSINYLTEDGDLEKCLKNVHNYLDPGGLFIFDVNTPYKFEQIYGNNHYIFDDSDSTGKNAYCGWQNEYDRDTKLCNFYLTVFTEEESGKFSRADEVQTERCYEKEELFSKLSACGLKPLGIFGGYDFSELQPDCERWYIVARAIK